MKIRPLILGLILFLSSSRATTKPFEEGAGFPKKSKSSSWQVTRLRLELQPNLTATEIEMLLDTLKKQEEQSSK
jgi:hypothetical protein